MDDASTNTRIISDYEWMNRLRLRGPNYSFFLEPPEVIIPVNRAPLDIKGVVIKNIPKTSKIMKTDQLSSNYS